MSETTPKICANCGQRFGCGVDSGAGCWCAAWPQAFAKPDPARDCFCPECLSAQLKKNRSVEAVEGEDYYFENGLLVMTAAYHIKRGSCCGNGCVWCPYEPRHEGGATKPAAGAHTK